MKILIVSGSFYPINAPRAFRTTELAKKFSSDGHDVTVLIPQTSLDLHEFTSKYPMCVKYYNCKNALKGNDIFVRILNRLAIQYFEYPDCTMIKSIQKILKQEDDLYDLLITIAMPHPIHWAIGKLYSNGHRIAKTWVADCGDPYMLCGTNRFKRPFYFKRIEKQWCKLCDYITVPNITSINGYYPEFHEKIRVIPQAFNFDEVVRLPYRKNVVPTFAFSGNIIPYVRDPRPILQYLSTIKCDFRFVLYCSKHHLVQPYKEILGDKLIINAYIPRLDLLKTLSTMDFLVNIENSTQVQVPSKLIDYALTRRPILSLNPNDLDKNKINQFLLGDYTGQYIMENIEQYNINTVAQQFLVLAK